MGRWRLLVAVAGSGLAMVAAQVSQASASMVVVMGTMLVALAIPLVLLNLVGPWLLQLLARIGLRRSRDAVGLLAARTLLEDPKQVWRHAGALPLTSSAGLLDWPLLIAIPIPHGRRAAFPRYGPPRVLPGPCPWAGGPAIPLPAAGFNGSEPNTY